MKQMIKHIILLLFLAWGGACFSQSVQNDGNIALNWEIYDPRFDGAEVDAQLNEIAAFIKENPQEIYLVTGHVDERWRGPYSVKLTLKRAQWVTQSLLERLGDVDVIMIPIDLEDKCPRIPHAKTEEEHACNRRVAIQTYSPNLYHGKCAIRVEHEVSRRLLSEEAYATYWRKHEAMKKPGKKMSERKCEKVAVKLRRLREDLMGK